MKCIQVGLIGFGFAGRIFHSNVIQAVQGLELAAIVERSGPKGGGPGAAAAFPQVRILTSVEEAPTGRFMLGIGPGGEFLEVPDQGRDAYPGQAVPGHP